MNGDYHDLPDELNQSRDNGGLDDDGDQDDQQVDSYIKVDINSAYNLGSYLVGWKWNGQWAEAAQWKSHQKG